MDYAGLQSTAHRLISTNGKPAFIRVKTVSTYNPIDGSETYTTTDYPVLVVETGTKRFLRAGTDIESTGRAFLVSVNGAPDAITTADCLILDGLKFTIENVSQIKPGTIRLAWEITASI